MPCHGNGMKTGCCPPAAGAPMATPTNANFITQADSGTPAPCGCLPAGLPPNVATIVSNNPPQGSGFLMAGTFWNTMGSVPSQIAQGM
jgi:hypothetical protein